ncbi:YdcF family protein [Lichenihabitans sp. Uapishka_5]|nr:YdcF family protein [Lichenihabitans sp. Uapishka_5]
MFFVLSKLIWFVVAPANLLMLASLFGLVAIGLGWSRAGRVATTVGVVGLAVLGFSPLGALILRPLEDRFPAPPADMVAPDGLVVLGGSTDETISAARDQPTVSDAATRITAAVELARRYPAARLVFSGGSGRLLPHARTEAEDTRRLWIGMGVDPGRITLEDRSRNTDENARFTAALVRPAPGARWLLVTSAFHMPRSVGLFRAAGFPVIAYPVDYHTTDTGDDLLPPRGLASGLARFEIAAREWVGLLVYRVTGRTHDLFPRPDGVAEEPKPVG